MSLFRSIFCNIAAFSLNEEYVVRRTFFPSEWCLKKNQNAPRPSEFKKNLNASKPSEHPPQVEECLKV